MAASRKSLSGLPSRLRQIQRDCRHRLHRTRRKKSLCRRHWPSRSLGPRADPPAIEWTPFTLAPGQLRLGAAWGDADVRLGSKADMCGAKGNVRFRAKVD